MANRSVSSLPRLPNTEARALFLSRHGLCRDGCTDTAEMIDRLGFVQIDSIKMVERAHHMILSARSKPYRPRSLVRLLEKDRALFEHWTHDAAVIPTAFFPYWRLRFARDAKRLRTQWRDWRRNGFEEKFDDVLRTIRDRGPVKAREVGDTEARSSGGWWDWHPSKTALEYLWRTGKLAVCRREGFQKVFDLAERVIPAADFDRYPSE
ncbi:MAG: crosslink repair DNA glycosylase YcaQ family protein, partial [Pseudomonadota bacterium]